MFEKFNVEKIRAILTLDGMNNVNQILKYKIDWLFEEVERNCDKCFGSGGHIDSRGKEKNPKVDIFHFVICPHCKGSGKIITQRIWDYVFDSTFETK